MHGVHIRLYDLFRKKLNLSDDKAAAFVAAVEEVVEMDRKGNNQNNARKEDIYKLELKIEQSKNDIYKAMFWSGIVQVLANIRCFSDRKVRVVALNYFYFLRMSIMFAHL